MSTTRILLSQSVIQTRVRELGRELSEHYAGKHPIFLGVMNGALFFLTDLLRAVDLDEVEPSTIRVASYAGAQSTGVLHGLDGLGDSFRGRHVLILDDILETGLTLSSLAKAIRKAGAADVKTCVLLEKPAARVRPIHADWVGFHIADEFVVGYGLDYNGRYRNLRQVRVLENVE